jgi:hypothetical protein
MKKLVVSVVMLWAAAAAQAAVVCATPQEMKVLQSAALQQQLMVAALTCHMSDDYNSFVSGNRARLIQSDNALKAFFASRRRGEDYNTYKTRIANAASLRSLHDQNFCDSARTVFDMALGRSSEHGGLAPEPPHLIDTGYEGCRPVQDQLLTAKAETKPVERRVASLQAARPAAVPVPKPAPTASARHALALATTAKPAEKIARLAPLRNVDVAPHTVVPPIVGSNGTTPAQHRTRVARAEHPNVRGEAEAARNFRSDEPQSAVQDEPQEDADRDAAQRYAFNEPSDREYDPLSQQDAGPPGADYRKRDADDESWRENEPAADERRDHSRNNDERYGDNNIPNAYRPGSVWVGDAGPDWGSVSYYPPPPPSWYPPRGWYPPPRRHLVRGPDGRWYVVIGRHAHWVRD